MSVAVLLILKAGIAKADQARWVITPLPYSSAIEPSINNSGEIVWSQEDSAIISSVRGQIADSGSMPHLANSGEVVYADWFGGPFWDLVSTTHGRLTFGGIIDINASSFDVNASGEMVYATKDTNGYNQIRSTVRGQITFDAYDHVNPCLNDHGEIVWYANGAYISSTRGILPGYHSILKIDNADNFCSSESLQQAPENYTAPHIFSSTHGFVINDPNQYQWGGSINDGGTMVWWASNGIYEGNWVTVPTLHLVSAPSGLALEWSTNAQSFSAQFTTNLNASGNWQPMAGTLTTNGANFHLPIGQDFASSALFRLSYNIP
jgi:hypothetical protein